MLSLKASIMLGYGNRDYVKQEHIIHQSQKEILKKNNG